ncbi:MAG: hypothetical protein WC522_02755 [Candidatus Omnitrophota bacterium]
MESLLRWLLGFIVGAAWSSANFYFTITILKISVLRKDAAKLWALILLKFPVLYLAGFLIVISKTFPLSSLLAGLTAALITMGIAKLCTRRA